MLPLFLQYQRREERGDGDGLLDVALQAFQSGPLWLPQATPLIGPAQHLP